MCDRSNVVFEVTQVWSRLKVVTPTVRDNTTVQNVGLADAPAVEPRFLEVVLKDAVRANLHVSKPSS